MSYRGSSVNQLRNLPLSMHIADKDQAADAARGTEGRWYVADISFTRHGSRCAKAAKYKAINLDQ